MEGGNLPVVIREPEAGQTLCREWGSMGESCTMELQSRPVIHTAQVLSGSCNAVGLRAEAYHGSTGYGRERDGYRPGQNWLEAAESAAEGGKTPDAGGDQPETPLDDIGEKT